MCLRTFKTRHVMFTRIRVFGYCIRDTSAKLTQRMGFMNVQALGPRDTFVHVDIHVYALLSRFVYKKNKPL